MTIQDELNVKIQAYKKAVEEERSLLMLMFQCGIRGGAPAWLKEEQAATALNLVKFVMDNEGIISFEATKTDEADN